MTEMDFIDEKEGRCLSPEELLLKYGLSPDHKVAISPTGFLHICPGIIYQLDTRVCSTEKTSIEPDMTKEEELLGTIKLFLFVCINH